MVARLANEAKMYQTSVTLHSDKSISGGAIATEVAGFMAKINETGTGGYSHTYTIFRTGHVPRSGTTVDSSEEGELAERAEAAPVPGSTVSGFKLAGDTSTQNVWSKEDHDIYRLEAKVSGIADPQQREQDRITRIVRDDARNVGKKLKGSHTGTINCVLVTEDKSSVFAKKAKLLTEDQMRNNTRRFTDSLRLLEPSLLKQTPGREVFLKSRSKLVTLSILNGSLVSGESQKPPSEQEITQLVGTWRDSYLGLYSTTLPVPSHLAQLAAQKAIKHLRIDQWDNLEDDRAPYRLAPVHADNEKTLWYL